ncbi:MAG: hypothetical protein IT289_01215 [Oligoflexia bacterium]|nr:hypothetical protein [Oligoflexia bacterium]
MKLRFSIALFSLLFLINAKAFGAPCCASATSGPGLLSNEERSHLTTRVSRSSISNNIDSDGYWERTKDPVITQTMELSGAILLSDRWQIGMAVPFSERTTTSQKYSGLGDVSGTIGYEYLPDWDYHPWRPRAVGYFQITAPTGLSIYDEGSTTGSGALGQGFWTLGMGTLLTKAWGRWDVLALGEIHRSLSREIKSQASLTANPGLGTSIGAGVGMSLGAWRLGGNVTWTYQDPISIRGNIDSEGTLQRYASASLSLNYMIDSTLAAQATYTDQNILGRPFNTSLSRIVSLQLRKQWVR